MASPMVAAGAATAQGAAEIFTIFVNISANISANICGGASLVLPGRM
jgi:hypothetical protein